MELAARSNCIAQLDEEAVERVLRLTKMICPLPVTTGP